MATRISLKDVAGAAEVSISTASLALSGDHRVSSATRERVVAAANRLGYVRDPLLAGLASGRFRHTGKPIAIAASIESGPWAAEFQRQAAALGMVVRPLAGPLHGLAAQALAHEAAALVLFRRGIDAALLAGLPLPTVLWEDESPIEATVDVIETTDWWVATVGAIDRVRAAGHAKVAVVLTPARPRHWHDDVRQATALVAGLPLLQWDLDDGSLKGFLELHRPDAVIGGIPMVDSAIRRVGFPLPFASLLAFDDEWHRGVAGWVADQDHRAQVTLELIEQRLRYGPRPPRRIVVPPRWQEGHSLRRV